VPELPEVETIVRDLRPHLRGARVAEVRLGHPSVIRHPDPAAFAAGLAEARLGTIRRRGKFMLLDLAGPRLTAGSVLVVHLGMSGTLCLADPAEAERRHTHLRLRLDRGRELRFVDPRRFGRLLLGRPAELQRLGRLPRLGREPLGPAFAADWWAGVLHASRRPLKALLLDQAIVSGCGNIYADEALFLARLRPGRRADRCTAAQAEALRRALPIVLRAAIRSRGSSIADYRDGFGARGQAHESLFVYGRGGLPCVRCGAVLRRAVVAGRTTVSCPGCQR